MGVESGPFPTFCKWEWKVEVVEVASEKVEVQCRNCGQLKLIPVYNHNFLAIVEDPQCTQRFCTIHGNHQCESCRKMDTPEYKIQIASGRDKLTGKVKTASGTATASKTTNNKPEMNCTGNKRELRSWYCDLPFMCRSLLECIFLKAVQTLHFTNLDQSSRTQSCRSTLLIQTSIRENRNLIEPHSTSVRVNRNLTEHLVQPQLEAKSPSEPGISKSVYWTSVSLLLHFI
ncbi:hypothetical protein LXL04_037185 [Taraxacum kok-saghyz]